MIGIIRLTAELDHIVLKWQGMDCSKCFVTLRFCDLVFLRTLQKSSSCLVSFSPLNAYSFAHEQSGSTGFPWERTTVFWFQTQHHPTFSSFNSAPTDALLWLRSGQCVPWPRFAQPWYGCAQNLKQGTSLECLYPYEC